METSKHTPESPLQDRLAYSEHRPLGISWPIALDHHLNQLVALANWAGGNTTRKEVVAALVNAFNGTPEELNATIKSYRMKKVGELATPELPVETTNPTE